MTTKIIPEIRLALFGQSGSGKTTFLVSYFGSQQRNGFENTHGYRLEAEDTTVGNQLLKSYYRMERGEFPLGTEQYVEYRFTLKITSCPEPGLRIVWYDYPGGWWERDPTDNSEKQARRDAFNRLLTSHVGILMIDGDRYRQEGLGYVRHVLDQFRAEARRISDAYAAEGKPLSQFPGQWILAISKADLLPPEMTAEKVCKDIVAGAADQLDGVAKAVNANRFGHQFLLLSSAQGDGARVINVHQYVGMQLVAPVALLSVLTEAAEKASKGSPWGTLAGVFEKLSALIGFIDKLDDFLPPKVQILTGLLKVFDFQAGANRSVDYFRAQQASAAKRGKALKAVAAAMQAEIASPEAERAFFRNQG